MKDEGKKVGGGLMREGEGWRRNMPKETRKMEWMEEVKRLEVEEKWEGVEEEEGEEIWQFGSGGKGGKVRGGESGGGEEEKDGGWRR